MFRCPKNRTIELTTDIYTLNRTYWRLHLRSTLHNLGYETRPTYPPRAFSTMSVIVLEERFLRLRRRPYNYEFDIVRA